jgi:hypothetical protein
MSPAFHHDKLENILPICVKCTNRMFESWNIIAENSIKLPNYFDLHSELSKVYIYITNH